MRVTGKVVRFDQVRGYGFITPDAGGEDVFLHVNDLEIEKHFARPSARVSFEIEEGERGKFATGVRLADSARTGHISGPANDISSAGDDYYDVLSVAEFNHLVTEALLEITPPINSLQILEARRRFQELALRSQWIEP